MVLIQGATYLVGLGTEAYAHRKQKKAAANETEASIGEDTKMLSPPSPSGRRKSTSSNASIGSAYALDDENEWANDEAQAQLGSVDLDNLDLDNSEYILAVDQDKLVNDFSRHHPPPAYSTSVSGRLPCPVIIPQKRPESKTHGFVRAYAPALNDCGIDQATFLDFLDDFKRSVKGEGYFNVVNVAIAASVLAYTISAATVNPAVHFGALAVHTSIEAGKRLHNTRKINTYLSRMNDTLFKPHGLYAMLMTYQPTSSSSTVSIDMNTNVLKYITARNPLTEGDKTRSKFHTASGSTIEAQLPEAAPLVFPILASATPTDKASAFKRSGAFMSDYRDRRARAQFQGNNPDSKLNLNTEQPEKFASIFSDPSHPINKGGSLNVLTGGYLYKGVKKLRDSGMAPVLPMKVTRQAGKEGTGVGGTSGQTIKRIIGENVIYLMVLNMPSDEKLREAAMFQKHANEAMSRGESWQ